MPSFRTILAPRSPRRTAPPPPVTSISTGIPANCSVSERSPWMSLTSYRVPVGMRLNASLNACRLRAALSCRSGLARRYRFSAGSTPKARAPSQGTSISWRPLPACWRGVGWSVMSYLGPIKRSGSGAGGDMNSLPFGIWSSLSSGIEYLAGQTGPGMGCADLHAGPGVGSPNRGVAELAAKASGSTLVGRAVQPRL